MWKHYLRNKRRPWQSIEIDIRILLWCRPRAYGREIEHIISFLSFLPPPAERLRNPPSSPHMHFCRMNKWTWIRLQKTMKTVPQPNHGNLKAEGRLSNPTKIRRQHNPAAVLSAEVFALHNNFCGSDFRAHPLSRQVAGIVGALRHIDRQSPIAGQREGAAIGCRVGVRSNYAQSHFSWLGQSLAICVFRVHINLASRSTLQFMQEVTNSESLKGRERVQEIAASKQKLSNTWHQHTIRIVFAMKTISFVPSFDSKETTFIK